jgi:hypothetical protein
MYSVITDCFNAIKQMCMSQSLENGWRKNLGLCSDVDFTVSTSRVLNNYARLEVLTQ